MARLARRACRNQSACVLDGGGGVEGVYLKAFTDTLRCVEASVEVALLTRVDNQGEGRGSGGEE